MREQRLYDLQTEISYQFPGEIIETGYQGCFLVGTPIARAVMINHFEDETGADFHFLRLSLDTLLFCRSMALAANIPMIVGGACRDRLVFCLYSDPASLRFQVRSGPELQGVVSFTSDFLVLRDFSKMEEIEQQQREFEAKRKQEEAQRTEFERETLRKRIEESQSLLNQIEG